MLSNNSIKFGLMSLLILGLTGCATKSIQSPISSKQMNQNYKVDVKREFSSSIFPDITTIVYINDEVALKGMLSKQLQGSLESMYNGKKLELVCVVTNSFIPASTCTVHLDNQRLGEYYFNYGNIKPVNE